MGADAIWVSNHGGRQLDSAPSSVAILSKIRAALDPAYPLIFDSGVRQGEDIVKALALGANFVMLGRPVMFALAAGGGLGLGEYLDEMTSEVSATMAQIGACSVSEITQECLFAPEPASAHLTQDNISDI